ncbi:MAG: hypothetical protein Q7J48_06600, partial [Nocardioides sp.]|nr:hypothetical protein [Nocardioides sp.]
MSRCHGQHLVARVSSLELKVAAQADRNQVGDVSGATSALEDHEAVDALPEDIDPDIRVQACDHLLDAAKHFDAKALRIQGRRILDVVAPEVGEAEEAKRLADRQEAGVRGGDHPRGSR